MTFASYAALEQGDAARAEQILTDEFMSAMSYYDTVEAFYHGVLLTLMQLNRNYLCDSNRESGKGRFDMMARSAVGRKLAFVLEVKVSDSWEKMQEDAEKAAAQIADKEYIKSLKRARYKKVITYGISFCEKACAVTQGETCCLLADS